MSIASEGPHGPPRGGMLEARPETRTPPGANQSAGSARTSAKDGFHAQAERARGGFDRCAAPSEGR